MLSRGKTRKRGRNFRQRSYTLTPLALLNQKPKRRGKGGFRSFLFWALLGGFLLVYGLLHFRGETGPERSPSPLESCSIPREDWHPGPELLAEALVELDGAPCLEVSDGKGPSYTLSTSLDPDYQRWVQGRLQRSMALGGVVAALDPRSGRILALASYNEAPEQPEAFFWKAYPAASLFKIITAAAAIESGILEPDSVLDYTGRNHTLYRRDLEQKVYPWSNRVTLRNAFALSVNPVFGKIGIHSLGHDVLKQYGAAFFFGQVLPSEVPFETSRLQVSDEPFEIAKIASGFNRTTLMSALHAAWIAAVLLHDGSAPVPWIVESARAGGVEAFYRHEEAIPVRVLSREAAKEMRQLMEATIRTGTCRKSFRGRTRDRHLRSVTFGGKTGNINNAERTVKYDWFLGYGTDENDDRQIALGVLMLHGRLLGHRANVMAYDLFKAYFQLKKG